MKTSIVRVGRPLTKPNRIKIGLSINTEDNDKLTDMSILLGKTKSRLIEEAIRLLHSIEMKDK